MARQTFRTTNVLRLEVEQTPTGLTNLVKNPPDDTGSPWGWITSQVTTFGVDVPAGQSATWLRYTLLNAVPNFIYTEDWAQAAGEWGAARLLHAIPSGGITCHVRLRFEWINSAGVVFASSTQSSYFQATVVTGSGVTASLAAQQAPSGTVRARLRLDFYGNTSGGNTAAGTVYMREVTAAKAATSGALTGLGYIDPAGTYTNILGATHTISVKRDELNVGVLTAEVLDATVDPSASTLIRPGKRCRLMALDNATATWTPVFTGKVSQGQTSYDPTRKDAKKARVTLTAVDAASQLSQIKRSSGVAVFSGIWGVLQGAGVPFYINTRDGSVTYVTGGEDTSALDQVAITRDSVLGYAWVNRRGVLQLWNNSEISTSVVTTLNESKYSDLNLDYDTDRCINSVTVKLRRVNLANGATAEVAYGPYVNQASIDQWGAHESAFTVQGITDSDAAAAAYAAPILSANGTPAVRINSVTVPILAAADIVSAKALLDLYDLVTVANTNAGISTNMRVTGITHTIESGKWTLELDLTVVASVAIPQDMTPVGGTYSLNAGGPAVGPSSDTAWASLTVSNMTSGTCQYCRRSGTVFVEMSGLKSGTNGTLLATLPVGFRPSIGVIRPSLQTGGVLAGVVVGTDGTIKSDFGTGAYGGFSFPV